ncbi:cell envelope integrity protein CreD [Pedobacter sp.]|uniref:cell envelope integrity protein CreD n=1 Tax=Pedobacter sp. TaxID=1411316 RepID=UPI003D7F5C73
MENQSTNCNGIINWINESILFRVGIIGFLTLLLFIPSVLIQELIQERQNRQEDVIKEIADKWSGSQLVEGPVMVLPYKTVIQQKETSGKLSYEEVISNIYILPETLNINSSVKPETLHRGIYDAVVYNAQVKVKGAFSAMELQKSGINPNQVQWDKVKVVIGVTDLKGLQNNPVIQLADQRLQVEPDFTSLKLFSHNLIILPNLSKDKNTALTFSYELEIRGSNALNFLQLGKTTVVKVKGEWNNPSFTGRYLPEDREVSSTGFSATWKIPFFNRPYPQQWIAENTDLNTVIQELPNDVAPTPAAQASIIPDKQTSDAYFGVDFKLPVDQYQKTMRSAKYSILVVFLTFISLLFTEMFSKKRVHLLNYVLIGAAMVIYYVLLLAFSEQVGFNNAYLIASLSTVALVGGFLAALLRDKRAALLFGGTLSVFYSFIFGIIQLQDMALLFGSVGLFTTVAVLMYLSTKIDWNKNGN